MPKIAILLVTYNPDWDKYRRTLYSIIIQKNVEVSLIIADDGSENDFFDLAEAYLNENNFQNYRYVKNQQNIGTVRNILSALTFVKAKYVKLISPGDYFYSENVLNEMIVFLENNPCSACFGDLYSYNSEFEIKKVRKPINITPYENLNIKKQKYSFFRLGDLIIGASLVYNTDRLFFWLSELCSRIKYTEDNTTIACMLANDEIIRHIPLRNSVFVWYEIGTGISTNADYKWKRIINSELKAVFDYLYNLKLIKQIDIDINFSDSIFKKNFLKVIFRPFNIIKNRFIGKSKIIKDLDVLRKLISLYS